MQRSNWLLTTMTSVLLTLPVIAPSGTALALPVTTEFSLSGIVNTPGTFNLSSLQSFTPVTETVTYLAGGSTVHQDFTGVPLYTFLTSPGGGGGIITTPGVSNDILRDYVVVTGSDGYQTVTSVGEIHPNFGVVTGSVPVTPPPPVQDQSLIAYQQANPPGSQPTDLGQDGFARTTAPTDIRGGRYVSNLANISVYNATAQSQFGSVGGGISQSFALAGQITNPRAFNLSDLQALGQQVGTITKTVTFAAGAGQTTATFTGVRLWDLLMTQTLGGGGVITSSAKNDILNKFVLATGTDGYKALVSLGEFNPNFGADDIMVAYLQDGQPLTSSGFARLVVPGDWRGGRYVSNLIGLEVLAPVPVPAAVWLFGSGLVGLAGMARRKQRGNFGASVKV